MGGKTKTKFALEPDRESAPTHHHTCPTCQKFRWTLLEDVEYDGDDDKVVHQRNLMHSKQCGDLDPDEREAPVQKSKFELTARQRENGAALAYSEPSGPQMLTTTEGEGGGPGPLLLDLNKEPDEDDLSVPTENRPFLAYSDRWGLPITYVEHDLAVPLYEGLLTPQVQKRKLLDLNREPDEDDL